MVSNTSERRLAENEVFFRSQNEKLQVAIDDLNAMAKEDNVPPLEFDADGKLHFYCECSNEDCIDRVKLSLNEYKTFHRRRDTFTILRGHEIPSIETIAQQFPDFYVVIKRIVPPAEADGLNPTDL